MAEGYNSESNLKCGICLSFYTVPRLLECYHVFCTPCLEKLAADSSNINCPLCRTNVILPHEGICGLKLYPFKISPIVENNDTDTCQLCLDENMATVKCLECKINLCSNCRDYHRKLKSSRNHELEPLKDVSSEHSDKDGPESEIVCNEHKKALSFFCKPCNRYICTDCCETSHSHHHVQTMTSLAQVKRNVLLVRVSNLKSMIPVLENTAEVVKTEENNYYKQCTLVKKEIQSHAANLKDVFCKTVDILTKKTTDAVDNSRRKDIKIMQTYLNELETEQLSLASLAKTTEDLINKYSNAQILSDYHAIGKRLDTALQNSGNEMPPIRDLKYECGQFDDKTIEKLFGKLTGTTKTQAMKPKFRNLPVPELAIKVQKVFSFEKSNEIFGIFSSSNDSVWILTAGSISLHTSDGFIKTNCILPEKNPTILRKSGCEIWFWIGKNAKKGNANDQEGYNVHFEGGIGCCFIHNGNLLVYNPKDKSLYEVEENAGVQRQITTEKLQNMLTCKKVIVTETKNLNLVISQFKDTVIVTDENGVIRNTFQRPGGEFRAISTDNYGNILVADYQKDFISLLSEDGIFQRELLTTTDGIYAVSHMTVDECGNLWFSDNDKAVKIYSYQ